MDFGFRSITMGLLMRRFVVTMGLVETLIDACITPPTLSDAGIIKEPFIMRLL